MSETVLKAAMISKKYKRLIPYALDWKMVYALDEVNIEIHQGDIYGFVGANGSGKTTFIRILAGLVQQTSGEIELFGEKNQKNLYQQRRFINGIIENPALDPALTAQDNLASRAKRSSSRSTLQFCLNCPRGPGPNMARARLSMSSSRTHSSGW